MSKKDKSKFRKRIKAQILKEMSQTSNLSQMPTVVSQNKQVLPQTQPAAMPAKMQTMSPESPATYQDEAIVNTKKDLKKSAIIIGSMIILIVALTIIDNKTGILLKAGNEIFKVLHINS